MEGQERRVQQNSPQDEEGGPESLAGEDLSDTQNNAVCHLDKRVELCEEFIPQRELRHITYGDESVLAFAVKATIPFCKHPSEVFPWQPEGCAIAISNIYKCEMQLAARQGFVEFMGVCMCWGGKKTAAVVVQPPVKAEHMKYK